MLYLLIYIIFYFILLILCALSFQSEEMSKIRNRSFTNYQSSAQLEKELLNQVFQEQNAFKIQIYNPESQKNLRLTGFGTARTKKAKLFSKFQKFAVKHSKNSDEGVNFSTIQSLKKQVAALQSDQIMSYRLGSSKNERKQAESVKQAKSNKEISQIQAVVRKFQTLNKQAVTGKFQRKLLWFKTSRINSQMKTQRCLVKKQFSSSKSDRILINNEIITLNSNNGQKIRERRQLHSSSKSGNTVSLTARKFHDKKSTNSRTVTQSSPQDYERQKSIKKLRIQDRVFSKSILAL